MPTGSLRERLEEHRSNPVCASCHTLMDPIGFGLEHYDGIGAYRETDQGFAIDASGDAARRHRPSTGRASSRGLLAADERLPRCMAQQLLTYALGRGTRALRRRRPRRRSPTAFVSGGYRFRELVELIVLERRRSACAAANPADAEPEEESP